MSVGEGRLAGRVALVTGASSGNGRAIALRYAREGAAVVCADLRAEPLPGGFDGEVPTHEQIAAAGGRAAFVGCDVTDGRACAAAVAEAVAHFGRLDIAVANAGINLEIHDLVDEPFADYEQIVGVNQHGAWWTCREATRRLVEQGEGGRVIAIASVAGLVGVEVGVAYNASKGAVVQLVRTLALQVARHGITVNAICPGWIRTAMTHESSTDPAVQAEVVRLHPLGRMGEPDDVAGAAFFLASDDAAWVTGIALPVDGGYTCR